MRPSSSIRLLLPIFITVGFFCNVLAYADTIPPDNIISEFDEVGREVLQRDAQNGEILLRQEYWDSGILRYSQHQGNENWFNENGELVRTIQETGDTAAYAEDGSFSIERPSEKKIFYYDADGREVQVTDLNGTVLQKTEYTENTRITTTNKGVTETAYLDEDGLEYRVEITPVFGFTIIADIDQDERGGTITLVNSEGKELFSAQVHIDQHGRTRIKGGAFVVRTILWFANVFGYDISIF